MGVKFYRYFNLLFLLWCIVGFSSCKKKCCDANNPDCENYDPCIGETRINSNFRVRPGDNGFKPPEKWCDLLPCDTFNTSSVRFDMPLNNPDNSTYTWQIGTEQTPRTGKGFEVDFSDYLDAGNWESSVPVTLTIKTPINACMTDLKDTLINVTRNLFFTKTNYSMYPRQTFPKDSVTEIKYRGYLISDRSQVFEFKITKVLQNYYKGYYIGGLAYFYVGLPFADSIMLPRDNYAEFCSNYKHIIMRNIYTFDKEFNAFTENLERIDFIVESNKKRTIVFNFFGNKHPKYIFKGDEIK